LVLIFIEAKFDAFGAIWAVNFKFTEESMVVHKEIFLKSARTLFKKKKKRRIFEYICKGNYLKFGIRLNSFLGTWILNIENRIEHSLKKRELEKAEVGECF